MYATLKRVLNWCDDYKKRLYIGCVYSFFNTIFTALPIMGAAYALNLMIESMNDHRTIDSKWIWYLLGFMVLTVVGRIFTAYRKSVLQESIGNEKAAEQRIHIGNILKRVSLGYFGERSTGSLLTAITSDLSFVELNGTKMIDMVLNGYISIIAIILCLAFYSITIALVSTAGVLLSGLFLKLLVNNSKTNSRVYQQSQNDITGATLEYIKGISIVKSFKQEGVSISRLTQSFKDSKNIHIKLERDFVNYNCLHLLVLKLTSVAVVVVASTAVLQSVMTIPNFLMTAIFSFTMFGHVEGISSAEHMLNVMDSTLDKLNDLENVDYIDQDGKEITLMTHDIHYKDVCFGYDTKEILHNVTFDIPEKTTTAIVGPSGSGKTTICSLLARFYDVSKGTIKIGNTDIRSMTCDSLLENISMVFQNVYLFHDTILNNIKFGNPNASMEEIITVAKKACCHDFIEELPDGYNTIIGEGGSTLSGGEKQRISIARAMLKDAPIVILDEATASIDPENEHLIQQAIGQLVHGKTIIIIAHRLATIENADQILVVEQGQIVQQGTHQELIQQNGVYQDFIGIRKKAEGWSI